MLTSHRLCLVLSACLLVAGGAFSRAATPTREGVMAYAGRCKAAGRRMDLIARFGKDFSGLDLSGVDFRGVHTVNYETFLGGANFARTNLRGADFGAAVLDGASFSNADLANATFTTASLKGVDFRGAKLPGVRFQECRLDGSKLSRADLSRATITGSSFAGAGLRHAKLAGAANEYWWSDFQDADLTGADLRGLKLAGARFQQAVLRGATLAEADLTQADFTQADLTGADLTGVTVEAADFRQSAGLDEDTKGQLVEQAGRGRYEAGQAVLLVARAAYWPAYFLAIVTLATLAVVIRRRRGPSPLWLSCTAVNAVALVPLLFLVLMALLGAAAVVQFNAGNPAALALWSAWVSLWPVCVLGWVGGLGVFVCSLVWFVAHRAGREPLRREKLVLAYAALTLMHLLLAWQTLLGGAPTA